MAHGSHSHGHDHNHHHGHSHEIDHSSRNIGFAFWVNLSFAVIELVGGLWTQSFAILSDALHDFGDALSLGAGYFMQRKSTTGPSENYSYGLRRLSLFSAFFSGLVICSGAVFIIFESISKINEPREPNGLGMMGLSIFGILVNGLAAHKLHHGHTMNEKMLKWHMIEDLLGWIAVFIGSIFIWAFHWNWLDPLMGAAIGLFVMYNVIRGLGNTVSLFMQGNPDPVALREFREKVEKISDVREVHDVHFWSLDGRRHILSLHAVLNDLKNQEEIKSKIRDYSHALGDCHVTIELESPGEHCHDDCEHPTESHE